MLPRRSPTVLLIAQIQSSSLTRSVLRTGKLFLDTLKHAMLDCSVGAGSVRKTVTKTRGYTKTSIHLRSSLPSAGRSHYGHDAALRHHLNLSERVKAAHSSVLAIVPTMTAAVEAMDRMVVCSPILHSPTKTGLMMPSIYNLAKQRRANILTASFVFPSSDFFQISLCWI